mmetsp:Transcript_15118/g.63789  ORF Transcript_15118/g.63789 Transcript_15118/m.63789 type:complete len:252 (+) Transcript_15118:859-1614(+)
MAHKDATSSPGVCAKAGRTSRSVTARKTPRHALRVTRAASACATSSPSSSDESEKVESFCSSEPRARSTASAAREARSSTYAAVPSDRTSVFGGWFLSKGLTSRGLSRSLEGSLLGAAAAARATSSRSVACSTENRSRSDVSSRVSFSISKRTSRSSPTHMPMIFRRSASSLKRAVSAARGARERQSGGVASPANKQKDSTKRNSISPPPTPACLSSSSCSNSPPGAPIDARNRGLHTIAPARNPHTFESS